MLVVLVALGSPGMLAQAQELQTSTPSNPTATKHLDSVATPDKDLSSGTTSLGKNWQVTSPLVRPFKAQRLRQFPGRLLHLINPFAKKEAESETATRSGPSERGWTTTVGWSPGQSAFADPVTHEPSLSIFSLKRTGPK